MESNLMYSEAFPSGPMRHYFFDYKQGAQGHLFLQISCSEKQPDGTYKRNRVIFFDRDLPIVVQALSSLCHHAAQLRPPLPVVGGRNEIRREKGIPSWDPQQKPRERLEQHGASALDDAELIGILIGSGIPDLTAVGLSANILGAFGGLEGLCRATFKQLVQVNGIGAAKASSILSAIEIARRLNTWFAGKGLPYLLGVSPT